MFHCEVGEGRGIDLSSVVEISWNQDKKAVFFLYYNSSIKDYWAYRSEEEFILGARAIKKVCGELPDFVRCLQTNRMINVDLIEGFKVVSNNTKHSWEILFRVGNSCPLLNEQARMLSWEYLAQNDALEMAAAIAQKLNTKVSNKNLLIGSNYTLGDK